MSNASNAMFFRKKFAILRDFVCGSAIAQLFTRNPLLTCQFVLDEVSCNFYICSSLGCRALRAAQPGIGRAHRPSGSQHGAIALQHHECSVLVCQPAERRQRDESVITNNHKTAQSVLDARETCSAPIYADAILANQMAALDSYIYAIAIQRDNAVARHDG